MYKPSKDLAPWLEHRRYPLFSDIDGSEAACLVEAITFLDHLNHEPILLMIDSSGGRSDSLSNIYDAINFLKSPVDGMVMGVAFSAAFRVLQFCRQRLAWANAGLMFHPAMLQIKSESSAGEIRKTIRDCRRDNLWHLHLLVKRSNCSMNDLKKWSKEERRFTAKEALRYGFIDKIVKKRDE